VTVDIRLDFQVSDPELQGCRVAIAPGTGASVTTPGRFWGL